MSWPRKSNARKCQTRDKNRHLDIEREVNCRMTALIDQYWNEYGSKKKSSDRERSVLNVIRDELGTMFVREVDGRAVDGWYQGVTAKHRLTPGTAVRHFNVMHHMMEKASTIWAAETGIDRNPVDLLQVKRPDDQRARYLSTEELRTLKATLDGKMYRQDHRAINRTFYRLRLLVLIALTTGMRMAEIFALTWGDVLYREGLIAVRSRSSRAGRFGTCR